MYNITRKVVDDLGYGKPDNGFGKSLFLDTLKELFEGNREFFTGLAAENACFKHQLAEQAILQKAVTYFAKRLK